MFESLTPNVYTGLSGERDSDKNHANESNSVGKPDSPQESNNFSKRMGFSETLSQRNQSISRLNNIIPKYSKHKIIPKPYPYSSGSIGTEQNSYVFPNTATQVSKAERKFSSRYIKPDWNRFEDSIDESLAEPENYPQNYDKQNIKSEEKGRDVRDNRENSENRDDIDNSYSTDDSFDNDYNGPHTEEPDESDITSEPFDFDIDKEDDREDKDDKDDYILRDYVYHKRTFVS